MRNDNRMPVWARNYIILFTVMIAVIVIENIKGGVYDKAPYTSCDTVSTKDNDDLMYMTMYNLGKNR